MAAGYDGRIRIDSRIDGKGFNSGIAAMIGKVKGLGIAIGIAFGIGAVVNFGKAAVSAASELASSMIGLQSVVEGTGNSFSAAKGFINDYIKDGLVPITNATTAYKNLLMRGYDVSQIETVLTALKDSASFGRQASLTLGNAVQSATEGLKNENSILVDNAGVTKNVSMMWKDYAATIGTSVGMLTKQQKIQAEVNGILEESRFQTGDAAKLAGTYAGQVSALGVSFYNLKTAIGNSIIPVLSAVMPYIKKAVDWLVVFFNKVAQFMSALFGVQVNAAANSVSNLADSTDAAAGAQDGLANSTKKAGKAAKGALASFDELNVLQMETADNTSYPLAAVAIPEGAIGDLAGGDFEIDPKIKEAAEKIRQWFINAWAWVKQAAIDTWTWIVTAWGNIGDFFARVGEKIKNVVTSIKDWFLSVWTPIAEWFKTNVIDPIAGKFDEFVAALKEHGQAIYEVFIKPMIQWMVESLWPAVQNVFAWIKELAGNVIEAMGNFWEWYKEKFKKVWDVVVSVFKNIWVMIAGIVRGILDVFIGIITFMTGVFTGDWEKAWEGVKQIFEGVWNVIASIAKGVINSIIDLINAMIRGIITGVNAAISALNSINVKVPDWVPGVGGKTWGVNIAAVNAPQIPRLATGAVIPANAPFAAILGDQKSGKNIEAPETLIRQIIQDELGGINREVTINFAGSLAPLIRELKPYIDRENTRIGKSLMTGGVV